MTSPELPRILLNTAYLRPTGKQLRAGTSLEFQAAINNAALGDEILLTPGAAYPGNFILTKKSGTGAPIVIRTDSAELPAEGVRVTPQSSSFFAKLETRNNEGALVTAAGAHDYRIIGVDISQGIGVTNHTAGLVRIGTGDEKIIDDLPSRIILDRCYIHGLPMWTTRRGVALHGLSCAIIDSYISDIHEDGADSQAICGWNGPGPYKITNNYLEASGENFMLGGADAKITNLVASDVEFRRNTCFKPATWNPNDPTYGGRKWSVKNLFELKCAQRVLVEGNMFTGSWVQSQTGFAIQLTPRNQDKTNPWAIVADIIFRHNIISDAAAGLNLLGTDDINPSLKAQRILVQNNLWKNIGNPRYGSNGRLFQLLNGADSIVIKNNTAFQTYNILTLDGAPTTNSVFEDNIVPHNDYGVIGSGQGVGKSSIDFYMPGSSFKGNVLVGALERLYPIGNSFPATFTDVQFQDFANANYRLKSSSPFLGKGVDFDALEAAMRVSPIIPSITIDSAIAKARILLEELLQLKTRLG